LSTKVNPIGLENRDAQPIALYVGNHLSYLDVLAISSCVPAGFVTSMEIRETPLLGLICEMAGCLFVERRNKSNLLNEVAQLSEGLRNGLNVAIFPEATSTNGSQILRFRRPLYMAAVATKTPVVPFCLNYRMIGGKPVDLRTRDSVFWYGDMSFAPHLWALCGAGGVNVDLTFLPAVPVKGDEEPGDLSQKTQIMVESVFLPVI
jgi:1-acyl-sn-glycerol-3-phosphate acyltransferase